ncbi:MAG: DUF6807 family protein [Pirellulales bacterium]
MAAAIVYIALLARAVAAQQTIEFVQRADELRIRSGDEPVASYYYRDREITRPFRAHVYAPGQVQVTRHHPPRPGLDDTDHGTAGNYFHPGVWLALSDLNGNDYWRLKAAVRHEAFIAEPTNEARRGTFTVRNSYRDQKHADITVANEICRFTVAHLPDAYLLVSDSLFWSDDRPLAFGDEEEMGFAVRVATPLAVKHGGRLLDSTGRVGEKQIRGTAAPWCDYAGKIDDRQVGIMLVPDPANPLVSRYHARDYGLLAANPFAGQALGDSQRRETVIEKGETLRLRFAVALHEGPAMDAADEAAELSALYEAAVKLLADLPRPTKGTP